MMLVDHIVLRQGTATVHRPRVLCQIWLKVNKFFIFKPWAATVKGQLQLALVIKLSVVG